MSKNTELAKRLRCNIFADRNTVDEALKYAYEVLKDNPAGLTAMYVVLNTVCNEIEANENTLRKNNTNVIDIKSKTRDNV